ncbi:MAG: family 20 glycosylhydrolase [Verrucomicrobia bacterium]|nr:family 20 glycosylhydrolase [Verrucomicrobiota bacterium]
MKSCRFVTGQTLALTALSVGLIAGAAAPAAAPAKSPSAPAFIQGIHTSAPGKRELPLALQFVHECLAKEGVNAWVVEFNTRFDFQSRPEFADPKALNRNDVRRLLAACREHGIELIPMINCLGHQSWGKRNGRLLEKHPEFDETPGKFPGNEGIYCRSWCPRHPRVHEVVFALMNELIAACEARSFHVGMDEVFILADPDCPRCKGMAPAALFAEEVHRLHDHLQGRGCRMWMWGDRFLDGEKTGLGKWEASLNHTWPAIDAAPRDLVICDWHYNRAPDTPRFFAERGFHVVASPWRKPSVALAQLKIMRELAENPAFRDRTLGMLQTTWCGMVPFFRAWQAWESGKPAGKGAAAESARCFRELFQALRKKPVRRKPAAKPAD